MPRLWIALLRARSRTRTFAHNFSHTKLRPVPVAPDLCPPHARSLFVCSFGKKLLQPKRSHTLSNDHTSILYGIGYEQWKDKRERKLWDGDFIEYQNYLQITVLKELLGISSMKADQIVHKYPIFHYTDPELIRESYTYLTQRDVSVERILRMPSLLAMNADTIETKSEKIMKLLSIAVFKAAAPFLEIQHNRLFYLSRLWTSELKLMTNESFPNRLYYLCSHLKCEPFEVADMMRKVPALMSMSFPLLTKKLQLLLDNGLQPNDIVNDPYIFSPNLEVIKEQLDICKKAKAISMIKPWMLRCSKDKINDHIRRTDLEEELLATHGDIIGYLQDALKIESAAVHELFTRVPSLKSVSAIKLNEMIQYLYSRGFTASDIMSNPYILLHSQTTVEERLSELNSFGYQTKQLPAIICWSTKRYKSFIRSLMANDLQLTMRGKMLRKANLIVKLLKE